MTTTFVSEPVRLTADHVSVDLADGRRLLDAVSLTVHPHEVIAIIGRSGAGKTTLLDTLAGVRVPTSGSVRLDGADRGFVLGYVPQDDIVHHELTVSATVRYAARLRLPASTPAPALEAAVGRTLSMVGLTEQRGQTVASLSGGQRKRVSIATELVTQPHACFLDEPTAGLDPMAAVALMDVLRGLADRGTPVVMTTHNLTDLRVADRLIVLADGGRVAFDGAPADAPRHFGVDDVFEVCRVLGTTVPASPPRSPIGGRRPAERRTHVPRHRAGSGVAQWRTLARRNVDLMARNRMSLAIMAGSPVIVVAMFAVLFEPGAFRGGGADPTASTAIAYWMSFAGFFFGLTFGLLQICTEMGVVRRERLVVIDVGPYLLAKVAVLVPALGVVNVVMVATLAGLGRIPALGLGQAAGLLGVLLLDSVAGLALGLLASATVSSAAQAALALPMLCFPAVLFSGAVLPVRSMTVVGRAIGAIASDRWAFEGVARTLRLRDVLGRSVNGEHLAAEHGSAFTGSALGPSLVMAALAIVLMAGAHAVVARRTRPA